MLTLRSGISRGPQGNISRRDLLQIGSLSALGISLPQWLASQDAQGANRKGREVNCILLWLLGGPSHIDMYDLKPDAPAGLAIMGAALGGAIFAASPLFWSQALITEVYALNALFAGALLLLATSLALAPQSDRARGPS